MDFTEFIRSFLSIYQENTMKKFCITICERGNSFIPKFSEVLESDELLDILSQLVLVIGRLHMKLLEEQYQKNLENDDDIPF